MELLIGGRGDPGRDYGCDGIRCPAGVDIAVAEVVESLLRRLAAQEQRDREQDEARAELVARLEAMERTRDAELAYLAGMCSALAEGYERLRNTS